MDGSKEYVELPEEDAMEVEEQRDEPEQAGPPRRGTGGNGQRQDDPGQAGPPRRRAGGNYAGTLWHEASEEEWAVIEETEAICGAFNSHVQVRPNQCAREEERRRESVDDYCSRNARKLERSGRRTERMAEIRKERQHRQRPRHENEMYRGMSFYPEASVFHSTANRRRGVPTPRPAPHVWETKN